MLTVVIGVGVAVGGVLIAVIGRARLDVPLIGVRIRALSREIGIIALPGRMGAA
jgi:hypothetical protein